MVIPASGNRAAVYIRMSTDKQEDSPERQRSQILPYLERQGYQLVETYLDEGIAGDEFDRRRSFQRLLADAKAGKFDVVVVDEVSRLSRQEPMDFFGLVGYPLKAAGVRVESVAEGQVGHDDLVQMILSVIRQDKAASESPRLARRVLTSHLLLAGKGGYTGGGVPYGYVLADDTLRGKKLVPDGKKAETVKNIFQWADEGNSSAMIRELLARRCIPSPTGKHFWSKNGIRKLLRNPRYLGDFAWGRQASGKHVRQAKGKERKRREGEVRYAENPAEDWVIKPDDHEPLIDRDLFERVQGRLAKRKKNTTPLPGGGPFLLNRLLVCGHCGAYLYGTRQRSGPIYVCGGWVSYGKEHCHRNAIRQDRLVRVLLGKLKEAFLAPDALDLLRKEVRQQYQAERSPDRVAALEARVQELAEKGARGLELRSGPSERFGRGCGSGSAAVEARAGSDSARVGGFESCWH